MIQGEKRGWSTRACDVRLTHRAPHQLQQLRGVLVRRCLDKGRNGEAMEMVLGRR